MDLLDYIVCEFICQDIPICFSPSMTNAAVTDQLEESSTFFMRAYPTVVIGTIILYLNTESRGACARLAWAYCHI